MNTMHVLESNMAATQEEFTNLAQEATVDDMPELAELSIQGRIALWALKTRHQIDYDLSSAALQGIK